MLHHYADDGRIMTPPSELEPLLKDAFPAFSKLLGHIRLFYMADEIWDGQTVLAFRASGKPLAEITLADGVFRVHIADVDFSVQDESQLDAVFEASKTVAQDSTRRPIEQLLMQTNDPTKFPCGYRCDLCEAHKEQNQFVYLNWLCYHACVPGIEIERPTSKDAYGWHCPGCAKSPWRSECKYAICPTERGCSHCIECGEYHHCGIQHDGHYAAQCNLGLKAEEVTSMVIPYCMKERFDIAREKGIQP
jgi:hypothetical protein